MLSNLESPTLIDLINEYESESLKYTKIFSSGSFQSMSQRKKQLLAQEVSDKFNMLVHQLNEIKSKDISCNSTGDEKVKEQLFELQDHLDDQYVAIKNNINLKYSKINSSFILNTLDLQEKYENILEELISTKNKNNILKKNNEKLANQLFTLQDTKLSSQSEKLQEQEKLHYIKQIEEIQSELEFLYQNKLDNDSKIKLKEDKLVNQIRLLQDELETQKKINEDDRKNISNQVKSLNLSVIENLYRTQEEAEILYSKSLNESSEVVKTYGAAEFVKNSIAYQLGALIVDSSKKHTYFKIPVKISQLYSNYLKECLRKDLESTEKLNQFLDVDEAEKVKSHLSFKIGKMFISNTVSLNKVKALPFSLMEEFFLFRNSQKSINKKS